VKVRGRRGSTIGPFRIAGAGIAAAAGVTVVAQATRALAESLETTGAAAFTTGGRIKNMVAALTTFNVVGAIQAWTRMPKTLEEAGLVGQVTANQFAALEQVASGTTQQIRDLGKAGRFSSTEIKRLRDIEEQAGTTSQKLAEEKVKLVEANNAAARAAKALQFEQRNLNVTMLDGVEVAVEFKGAVDDLTRAGRGEPVPMPGALRTTPETRRPYRVGANERAARRNVWFDARVARQLDILQDKNLRGQLAGLKTVEAQLRARLEATKDATRRLTLEEQIRTVNREQLSIQEQMTEQAKAANQALKDRAEAIKSAVIERLQRKQTNILNQRALQDALEQLRIAKQMGGPRGILEARRGVTDVRYEMMLARLQAQPATLTRGGMFSLGNQITINVNGATDPDKIARQVVSIIQRRTKQTNEQTRGSTAGSATGNK